ncbi:sugar ABC transporter ATP-binding protein [Enterovibrio nigricans]|uniref:Rhamnose ABC transporter ATP-binding protein n=1 Tax=Enterovibrio nigricans DSM 22720 TaxID=1121868 RepID=A0A1T4VMW8_9GAMM|nr:sugar ABC transporter ATP-binding protein [Enterovibrio nigricans]SKA66310.1 rhamnose ABC transporter ATP-binding protein [Enterovibrio nigricans DSM 22720]
MTTTTPLLALNGITKSFPGVKALNSVNLELYAGQVVALIGENGAGKSTLVKTITGIYQADEGKVFFDGESVDILNPESARSMGITAIHQETVLFDELTVTENIFAGHYLRKGRWGMLDWPKMHKKARKILLDIEAPVDPKARLKQLSIGQRHMVAIARALSFDARVVILDEPTAALSFHEIEELYKIVERLKAQGCAILFISHKFDEIFRIADRYTVYRDGCYIAQGDIEQTSEAELVTLMVGRTVDQVYPKGGAEIKATILEVCNLSHPTEFDNISFQLRRGEILGFYGLVGAGRTELMQAIFGVSKGMKGNVFLDGQEITINSPAEAIRHGIVYVPEERQAQGAIIQLPIYQNIGLPQLDQINSQGLLNDSNEYNLAQKYAKRLHVKAPNLYEKVENLSGGNQQKVVIGK